MSNSIRTTRPQRTRLGPALLALALHTTALGQAQPAPQPLHEATDPTAPRPAVWVGRFSEGAGPWQERPVKAGLTPNRFQLETWDGVAALTVTSSASASLMARALTVNLDATPVLCWRWRVDAALTTADLRQRQGDDAAARLYVNLRLPPDTLGPLQRAALALGRRIWGPDLPDAALTYVWDNRLPPGTELPNAYTDRAHMVVLRSGNADAGRWVTERRHVRADAQRHFGPGAQAVQMAVTADTDNTGEKARAGFADLQFVADGQACPHP
jgi:hypothetical protein